MTVKARQVLFACEAALDDLRNAPQGMQWITRWAAAVALLRAVGQVLHKVDTRIDDAMRRAIGEEWDALRQTKPQPSIFWGFIEAERNNILKVYQWSARQNINIQIGGPTTLEHLMKDGPFEGQDPRDVVAQAIAWWRTYLDRIDRRAESARQPER